MSGFRNRPPRRGGIRWMDELDTDTDPFRTPSSWRSPEPPTLYTRNRTDLNNELQSNERLHFGPHLRERLTPTSVRSSSPEWWRLVDMVDELPNYEQHQSGTFVDEVLGTSITTYPVQDHSSEAGPSYNTRAVEENDGSLDRLSSKWKKHGYEETSGYCLLDKPSTQSSSQESCPQGDAKLFHKDDQDVIDRLHNPPTESSFLESYPKGNATLTYPNDNNVTESIYNVNVSIIEERCPVLAMAFEECRSGPQLYLETLTSATALPFLRYLYTGTYTLKELYRLADIHDLPDLKSQAYVNVLRQCEFGCSSPDKPIELCAAVRFIYEHLREHDNLVDAIINYCVSCFLRHHLAEDEQFKQLAYELRPFHQDLCKNSMNREFENETAMAIVQMPFKPYIPETYASREDLATAPFDHVYHFHSDDDLDNSQKKRKRSRGPTSDDNKIILPLRARQESSGSKKDERELQDEDCMFGSKRRASSVAGPSGPGRGGFTQLLGTYDPEVLSDTEYEIVEGPAQVEEASDSDSDSSTLVEVKREDLGIHALPLRNSGAPNLSQAASKNDSDSEWTLL